MFMLPLLKLQGSLCKNVKVLGFVPDSNLPELYNYADLFLMPSLTMESFGITAIESLACATPVVATKAGALPEIIRSDGITTSLWEFPKTLQVFFRIQTRIRKLGREGKKLLKGILVGSRGEKNRKSLSRSSDGEFHGEHNT